jgi:hypothetical protein
VAGTYSVVVTNQSGPRSYAHNYTVSANTVTCPSLVIPGDTAGALGTTTAYALLVVWDFGSGSTRQTSTLDAWAVGNPLTTTTATPFIGATNGATFDLSAVRLYAGQADVPWVQEYR